MLLESSILQTKTVLSFVIYDSWVVKRYKWNRNSILINRIIVNSTLLPEIRHRNNNKGWRSFIFMHSISVIRLSTTKKWEQTSESPEFAIQIPYFSINETISWEWEWSSLRLYSAISTFSLPVSTGHCPAKNTQILDWSISKRRVLHRLVPKELLS